MVENKILCLTNKKTGSDFDWCQLCGTMAGERGIERSCASCL